LSDDKASALLGSQILTMMTEVRDLQLRFGGLERRFSAIDSHLSGIDARLAALESRFSAQEQRMDNMLAMLVRMAGVTT
jgi:hypothetical protein